MHSALMVESYKPIRMIFQRRNLHEYSREHPRRADPMNYVYLLRCSDGSLYCGWTTDPDARLKAHNAGKGAKYTRSRLPVEMVWLEVHEDRREALSREWHIKRMSRAEKEKLIARGIPDGGESSSPAPLVPPSAGQE